MQFVFDEKMPDWVELFRNLLGKVTGPLQLWLSVFPRPGGLTISALEFATDLGPSMGGLRPREGRFPKQPGVKLQRASFLIMEYKVIMKFI
jgi:hypothetical protein